MLALAYYSTGSLADQLGKNRRSVAAWEGGEYLPKTKGDVLELARILGLNDEVSLPRFRRVSPGWS